jgi:hypothetical protein
MQAQTNKLEHRIAPVIAENSSSLRVRVLKLRLWSEPGVWWLLGSGSFSRNETGHYFRVGPGSNCVDVSVKGVQASCCGVNLVSDGSMFGVVVGLFAFSRNEIQGITSGWVQDRIVLMFP